MAVVRTALIILAALALTIVCGFAAIGLMIYIFALSLTIPSFDRIVSTLIMAAIFYVIIRKLHKLFRPAAYEIDTTISRKGQLK